MKIKTLIVDDERHARDFIESIVRSYCPQLEICGIASNEQQALNIIDKEDPDLLLLDIEIC